MIAANVILCSSAAASLSALPIGLIMSGNNSPIWHNAVAFIFGCSMFGLYALRIARANDRLPKNMNTVEVSRSLLFCYGLGSLVAPLLLGMVTQFAPNYGFYGFYALMAAGLAAFAYTQSIVPEEERSVFVNVPGNTAAMSADLDPRYPHEQSGAEEAQNGSDEEEAARKTD